MVALVPCAAAAELESVASPAPGETPILPESWNGCPAARYREFAAMRFDAYCCWAVRAATALSSLDEKKHDAAVVLCASVFENPHCATMIWNHDDPRVVRVKQAVLNGLAPERNGTVEKALGVEGKRRLKQRMASGVFWGEIAFFSPRPAATPQQFDGFMSALDAWQSAVAEGHARMRDFKPEPHAMPHEIQEEKERLFQRITRTGAEQLEHAQLLDVHYSDEQATALRAKAWECFLTFWLTRSSAAGTRMTESEFLEQARRQGLEIEKDEAVAAILLLEQDVLRLWEAKKRQRAKPR